MKVWRPIEGFFLFWYDFVIGDDWTVAASIAVALVITSVLNRNGLPAWWLMPVTVVVVTGTSLRRWAMKGSPP